MTNATKPCIEEHDVYPCPICRHGEISALFMTEAFACNFCRHIFSVQPDEGVIKVEDSSQPLTWRWNGRTWQSMHREDWDLTIVIWSMGLSLIFLPPTLVFVSCWSAWGSPALSPWTLVWTIATFCTHFVLISWMLAEHYQVAPYISGKVRFRDWLEESPKRV